MSETITSKITKVTGNGKWESPNGLLYKFEVEFENHDVGGVMTKDLEHKKWIVGETVGYTKEVKGNFTNFKRVEEKTGFGGNPNYTKAPFNPEADNKRQAMIVLQSSLAQANQFHTINGYSDGAKDLGGKLRETMATAEYFAKKILTNPLLTSANIVLPSDGNNNRNSAKPFVEEPVRTAAENRTVSPITPESDLPF
ncbi:MAG: hypothetical protein QG594_628 [Bacteroidota bacterium]|nr:hypothetical protein [Bacteroidota bacterium]